MNSNAFHESSTHTAEGARNTSYPDEQIGPFIMATIIFAICSVVFGLYNIAITAFDLIQWSFPWIYVVVVLDSLLPMVFSWKKRHTANDGDVYGKLLDTNACVLLIGLVATVIGGAVKGFGVSTFQEALPILLTYGGAAMYIGPQVALYGWISTSFDRNTGHRYSN